MRKLANASLAEMRGFVVALPLSKASIGKAANATSDFALHNIKYVQYRRELSELGVSVPDIRKFVMELRVSPTLADWKLAAIRQGATSATVFHVAEEKAREKLLLIALQNVAATLRHCAYNLRFASAHHGIDPYNALQEHAIQVFRWIYPFTKDPSAMLACAIRNRAHNVYRSVSSQSRSSIVGGANYGDTRQLTSVSLDDVADSVLGYDPSSSIDSIIMDKKLAPIANAIVEAGKYCPAQIARDLQMPINVVESIYSELTERLTPIRQRVTRYVST